MVFSKTSGLVLCCQQPSALHLSAQYSTTHKLDKHQTVCISAHGVMCLCKLHFCKYSNCSRIILRMCILVNIGCVTHYNCTTARVNLLASAKLQGVSAVNCCTSAIAILLGVQLLERAATWTELVGCQHTVHYHTANATVSLYSMLSNYTGPIKLITIQVRQLLAPHALPSSLPLSVQSK